MQMNPHFLFNTLSLVIRSIQLGERDTSIQLVKAISKILRSSIEINTVSIPLDAEIELLQSYLYIQKLHLKGRVTFCLDVRKSFMDEDVMIPPLTIQPLVENSIQHGLKDRVNGGKVDILITEKPDYIEAVVADNGVGFPEEPAGPQGYAYPQNFHRPEKCGGTVKAVLPERGCAAYPADGGNYKDYAEAL